MELYKDFVWTKLKQSDTDRDKQLERIKKQATRLARQKHVRAVDRVEGDAIDQQQEDQFVDRQLRVRARLRIQEQRGLPIDYLVLYFSQESQEDPMKVIQQLKPKEIVELKREIDEISNRDHPYWTSIIYLLEKQSEQQVYQPSAVVKEDVLKMFESKSVQEMDVLQAQINQKLDRGGQIDVDYWMYVLRELQIQRAKQIVNSYTHSLSNRYVAVKRERDSDTAVKSERDPKRARETTVKRESDTKVNRERESERENERQSEEEIPSEPFLDQPVEWPMKYEWEQHYNPRTPKFLNHVEKGYEWNDYNKRHYTNDNPPPKRVQGYRFNIFYPDLVDNQLPTFHLEPFTDTHDYLRFSCVSYKDLVFKIEKREWIKSEKQGFRCEYKNGCLQLWFRFKKLA
ncbi:cactus-binding C-terminus of cactin protein-domain-containing protein [Gorgonomyces haynaldii]|nr:cactus-binding C-terminus of cactin protein-domain-containing protein [Gorgonomyces haynaldii]